MKDITLLSYHKISKLLLGCLFGSLMILTSCKEEDPTAPPKASGPPAIQAVRTTNAAKADSTFTESTLGSTVVIVGQNLAATRAVYFNGYETAVNPVYATQTHVIVRIPDLTPTVATDPNVPNELKVVNAAGEATYEFKVLPPAPVVDAISNEFAQAGETITLFGRYFYFVKEVTFPGGIKTTEVVANDPKGTSMSVKVPAGFDPAKGDLIVTSQSGNSAANRRTKFYNKDGILLNWEVTNEKGEYTGFGWGLDPSKSVVNAFPGITPIDNKFAVINQVVPGGWGWNNDKVISMSNWATNRLIPAAASPRYDANAPITNFDLKMEVAAAGGEPIQGLELLVWVPGTPAGTVEKSVPLADFVRSTDGKWYTVSVSLGDLANKDNAKISKYADLNPNEVRLVVQNPTAAGIKATLAIDNIRIENMVVR